MSLIALVRLEEKEIRVGAVQETVVVKIGVPEIVEPLAKQAATARDEAVAAAEITEDALQEIRDLASGAPDAPSILNKANRNGSNVEADAFRGAIGSFATRAQAMSQSFAPGNKPSAIRLDGYASAGDGGGALYKPAASEPPHDGKFQTADGQWWEIAEPVLRPAMFGALGDGVANDTTALASMFACPVARAFDMGSSKTYRVILAQGTALAYWVRGGGR